MSFPTYIPSCCLEYSTDIKIHTVVPNDERSFQLQVVNIVCLISSTLSLLCVLFLLLPRDNVSLHRSVHHKSQILTGPNLLTIVNFLLIADCLGSLGILIRSAFWIAGYLPPHGHDATLGFNTVFCAFISVWIQFFYLCTYFWNLAYGIEAVTMISGKNSKLWVQLILGVVVPMVFCTVEVIVIYYPNLHKCNTDVLPMVVTTLMVFLPILLVIICNPVFFYFTSRGVKKVLIRHFGRYTTTEREVVEAVRLKFVFIMVVFLTCWVPNIISVILISSSNDYENSKVSEILWVIKAFLNPMQAFLNCLAFRGWPGWHISGNCCPHSDYIPIGGTSAHINLSRSHRSGNAEPVVSFRRRPIEQ